MFARVTLPVRRLVRRGFQPLTRPEPPTSWIVAAPDGTADPAPVAAAAVAARLGSGHAGGIGLVLPTYVSRSPLDSNRDAVRDLVEQLTDPRITEIGRPVVLFVGMQWRGDEREEALDRLARLRDLVRATSSLTFVGVAMPQIGKIPMLNAAFGVATEIGLAGVAWVDDDVSFSPGCIGRVVRAFLDRGARGSVGAHKVPRPTPFAAARILQRGKQITKTQQFAYPHGCCMIVDAELAARGVPERYTCEDDYYCFALIDPDHENPLHRTHIVPDAHCYHMTGGPAGEIRRRVTRSLRTAIVLMADYPDDVVDRYAAMYFYGLWPLTPFVRGRGVRFAAKKWLLKAVHFAWFSWVALGLAARGLVGRPRRGNPWSAYSRYERPAITGHAGAAERVR